ncbi:MAG: acetate kinase, partial [Lachnospiraceae bacterium]|nr:acetate kinase [Lachnospiraceae bacterium]
NKDSGMYGISGKSSDFRDLDEGISNGDERCRIAVEVFAYQAAKFIGGYAAAMNGVDAITFTAGVGENNKTVRSLVCERLGFLGIKIDDAANSKRGEEVRISTDDSKVPVYVIPTNEELAIARETVALI